MNDPKPNDPQAPSPARAEREAVIEVRDLVMRFGQQTVLSGLDLSVHRGETLVVMGGSGNNFFLGEVTGQLLVFFLFIGQRKIDHGALLEGKE